MNKHQLSALEHDQGSFGLAYIAPCAFNVYVYVYVLS